MGICFEHWNISSQIIYLRFSTHANTLYTTIVFVKQSHSARLDDRLQSAPFTQFSNPAIYSCRIPTHFLSTNKCQIGAQFSISAYTRTRIHSNLVCSAQRFSHYLCITKFVFPHLILIRIWFIIFFFVYCSLFRSVDSCSIGSKSTSPDSDAERENPKAPMPWRRWLTTQKNNNNNYKNNNINNNSINNEKTFGHDLSDTNEHLT